MSEDWNLSVTRDDKRCECKKQPLQDAPTNAEEAAMGHTHWSLLSVGPELVQRPMRKVVSMRQKNVTTACSHILLSNRMEHGVHVMLFKQTFQLKTHS